MGTRSYRRNSRGQFAGSGGRVTYGRAGGFANAGHRAKAQNAKAAKRMNSKLAAGTKRGHPAARKLGRVAANGAVRLGVGLAVAGAVHIAVGPVGGVTRRSGVRAGARYAVGSAGITGKKYVNIGKVVGGGAQEFGIRLNAGVKMSKMTAQTGGISSGALKAATRGRKGYKIRTGR